MGSLFWAARALARSSDAGMIAVRRASSCDKRSVVGPAAAAARFRCLARVRSAGSPAERTPHGLRAPESPAQAATARPRSARPRRSEAPFSPRFLPVAPAGHPEALAGVLGAAHASAE